MKGYTISAITITEENTLYCMYVHTRIQTFSSGPGPATILVTCLPNLLKTTAYSKKRAIIGALAKRH